MEEDRAVALSQMKQAIRCLGSSPDNYLDATLLRFLKARSMVPEKAAKMFVQWEAWRASTVPSGSISEDEIPDQLNDKKAFLGGLTKEGYPLVILKGNRHYPPKDKLQLKKFIIYFLDKSVASAYKGGIETGTEKVTALIDLGDIPFKNFDAQALITGFQLLQNYYPERLAKCYIVDMPRVFVGMWRMVSYFLDKATKEKITFVSNENERKEMIKQVGEDVVPKLYGGKAELVPIQDVIL
ncbi:hypothetical protein Droror1_Dr00022512 [Drosera rotundifolia]